MIRSLPYQTNHILTALNNYVVDIENPEYLRYQYAYFELDEYLHERISNAHKIVRDKKEPFNQLYLDLKEPLTLIETAPILHSTHGDVKGFEHIKLDSMSFLEKKPDLTGIDIKTASGGITCHHDYFTIDIEIVPDGLMMPTIIYKSPRYEYSKINLT